MLRHATLACLVVIGSLTCADEAVIDPLDELHFRPPAAKGTATLVAGHDGQAIAFKFDKDSQNVFFASNIRGKANWDESAGFSFWLKGDGSQEVGVLQFIYDDDYAVRYEYAFPLKDTQWHKVTVAWHDLIPVLPGKNSNLLEPKGGNKPSKLSALWIGKWWHWRDYPAHSFALDDLRLEATITTTAASHSAGLTNVRKKLRQGEPITIVTMGDSLTDPRHWANRQVVWPDLLKQSLERKYKSKVTIINPAVGGTQLRQGLIQIPRWQVDVPEPDLVTVCFGGNDWDAGMRGPQFLETYLEGIDRIRRATNGHAEVLLLSTVPSLERWATTAELADACRDASQRREAGLADLQKAFHLTAEKDRERLFVNDKVHLSEAGHRLVAEAVLGALEAADGK
jgi:lysophospholipase L1-like esterase